MPNRDESVVAAIRESRRAAGLSQFKLAALLGMSRSQLAMIETGRTPVTPAAAARLDELLGLSITVIRPPRLQDICGTLNRYQDAGCRCAECRKANREHTARSKAKRIAAGRQPPVHGRSGYLNYHCRCAVCTSANSDLSRERRARIAQGAS